MRYNLLLLTLIFLSISFATPSDANAANLEQSEATLSLPTVYIESSITSFPIVGNTWQINSWEHNVGHFQGTAWIQDRGNIVLGGHSTYPDGTPGVFYNLFDINIGDPIYLTVDGQERVYIVTEKRMVNYRNLDAVRPTVDNRLTLITCDTATYSGRLVVVAVLS